MLSRRSVLEVLAGATATAALSGCATGSRPDPVAAWRNPGAGEQDPRRWALAHAILAPNPHNMQPWLVELPGSDEIALYVDTRRMLPATDPPCRQITIGCGTFLELLDVAAREKGYRAETALWPEGEPQPVLDQRPVARVRLVRDAGVARDPLFAQITRRHTNRVAYDLEKPPSAAELQAVSAEARSRGMEAGAVTDPQQRQALIALGVEGLKIENRAHDAHMESVRVMRIGADEIARHRDGIALDGPMIEALKMAGLMSREALTNPDSFASKSGESMWTDMVEATPAFFWIKAADNSRITQINAGRAYARAHLAATRAGLSMQPWSMTLQEYPEMASPYARTQALLGASAQAPVQMLVRVGRGKPGGPSPRRGLAEHIRT